MGYEPFCSTEICFASLEEAKARLLNLDAQNPVVILNETAAARWGLQEFIGKMQVKYNLTWINRSVANPTQFDILSALKEILHPPDLIIGIGGGSVIDMAKGISALYEQGKIYSFDNITQAILNKTYLQKERFIDVWAIPTTAGTGSEMTQWATIWDADKRGKYSIDAFELKPKLAFIIPELTITVPAVLTLATGFDALCHAVEAYWSRHTNPLVQELAYQAVKLIMDNLRLVVERPLDGAVRERLCRGSVLAGLAFSQTRTTACHSISYPLTMLYHVPHGFAAAITLDAVSHFNHGHYPNDNRLEDLFSGYGGIMDWIDRVCDGVVRMRLSAFGVNAGDLSDIADRAFTGGRMDNNPVDLEWDDVAKILHAVL